MNDQELEALRKSLIDKITSDSFEWLDATLEGGIKINVCSPVMIDNYYVPVTAKETRNLARRFGVLPLTRAVADQVHNQAVRVPPRPQPLAQLKDFVYRSAYLKDQYAPFQGWALVSGAHKLWVLSSRGNAINYGFYVGSGKGSTQGGGPLLDSKYTVIQSLGGAHNEQHWDYSQLLQLMYAPAPLEIGGAKYSLAMAIVAGLPQFWDEERKLTPDKVS